MNINNMQSVVNSFLEENFPFSNEVTVAFSENTARAQWIEKWDGCYIEFNKQAWIDMNMANNKEAILNTLIHECLHHALYCEGQEYCDGDYDFEQELVNFGAESNFEDFELEDMFDDIYSLDDRQKNFENIKKLYLNML